MIRLRPGSFSIRTLLLATGIVAATVALVHYRLRDRNRDIDILNQYVAEPNLQPVRWGGSAPPSHDTEIGIAGTTWDGNAFVVTVRPESDFLWHVGRIAGINLTNTRIIALEITGTARITEVESLTQLRSLESLTFSDSILPNDEFMHLARCKSLRRIVIVNSNAITTESIAKLSVKRPDIEIRRIIR